MKRRTALVGVGGVVLLAVVVFLAALALARNSGRLRIVNDGTERVVYGNIEICGQKFSFEDLKQGEDTVIHYKVRGDSHYKINVQLESGATLNRGLGYVSSGIDFDDTLTIKNSDISLFQKWRM